MVEERSFSAAGLSGYLLRRETHWAVFFDQSLGRIEDSLASAFSFHHRPCFPKPPCEPSVIAIHTEGGNRPDVGEKSRNMQSHLEPTPKKRSYKGTAEQGRVLIPEMAKTLNKWSRSERDRQANNHECRCR